MNLSCHGNVISKFTSFVAVDCDGKAVELEPVDRPCPVPSITQQYLDGILQVCFRFCPNLYEQTTLLASCPVYLKINFLPLISFHSLDFSFMT